MTSSDGFDSRGFGVSADLRKDPIRDPDLRVSDEEAAKWTALLAQAGLGSTADSLTLTQVFRKSVSNDDGAGQRMASSTEHARARQNAGVLGGSQIADTPSVNDTREQRLIVDVNSETLGRVQLVIDREEGGVRVLVGSDPQAKAQLSAGKHTLGEALSAAGVRLQSLRFVTQSEVGTVLAQDRVNKRARDESPPRRAEDDANDRDKSRKRRNLNLVG